MANLVPAADVESICAHIEAAHGIERLRSLLGDSTDVGPEMLAAILEEASKFNEAWLAPLGTRLDRAGCRLEDGRVRTAPGHAEAWTRYLEAGWLGVDQPASAGGQALPLFALAACQEVFDRGSVAFGMLPTAVRGAARLIEAHAAPELKAEWSPRLVSGEWAATICISESDAGSDVGRIRTLAEPHPDGRWRITGEKIWTSYGDHDLAGRIGHCLLARTPGAPPGGAGLSLFLVPDSMPEGRNAIVVRRLEEKLGLHGSPTCALGFEGAWGWMIGAPGRGLAQLFTMIAVMRLMVSVQGLAIASAATDVAFAYAEERRQGGRPDARPTPIVEHADVRRMLAGMASRVEVLRGLIMAAAVQADLTELETDEAARGKAHAFAQWLLPIIKTLGAETGFELASEAIQVLGGAGYVRDWPVEQLLRDARVLAIFEGTSGMQALDLLHRRLGRDQGRGLGAFLEAARADIAAADDPGASRLSRVLVGLERAAGDLAGSEGADAAAYPLLQLAGLAATGWIALRLTRQGGRLAAAGRTWLVDLEAKAALAQAQIAAASERLAGFDALRRG
jgi:alkylation response protein AidB-like acyl-CoA dehydrogenase